MNCTHCGYPDSSVVYTRHDDRRDIIARRRECTKCGMRYTTHEQVRDLRPKNTTIPPYRILPA